MGLKTGLLWVVVGLVLVGMMGCGLSVTITEPADGSHQKHKVIVKGTISSPKANIYLFVRELPGGQPVLQPSIWVREEWDGTALLGSAYVPTGGEYEIFALASKKALDLVPGTVEALPEKYDAKSNVVKVYREE